MLRVKMGRTNNPPNPHLERLQENIVEFWRKGLLCDTLVTTYDSAPVMAHSLVLAATSDVLHSELKRYQGSIYKMVDTLSQHRRDAIHVVLNYCYTGILKQERVKKTVICDMFQALHIDHKILKNAPSKDLKRVSSVEEGQNTSKSLRSSSVNSETKVVPQELPEKEIIRPDKIGGESNKDSGVIQKEPLPVSRKDHLLRSQKKMLSTVPVVVDELQSSSPKQRNGVDPQDIPTGALSDTNNMEVSEAPATQALLGLKAVRVMSLGTKTTPALKARTRLKETTVPPEPTPVERPALVPSKSIAVDETRPRTPPPTTATTITTLEPCPVTIAEMPTFKTNHQHSIHKSDLVPKRRVLTKAERKHLPTKLMGVPRTESDTEVESQTKQKRMEIQGEEQSKAKGGLRKSNSSDALNKTGSNKTTSLKSKLLKPHTLCNQCKQSFQDEIVYQGHLKECLKSSAHDISLTPKNKKRLKSAHSAKKSGENNNDKETKPKVKSEHRCAECDANFDTAEELSSHRSMHFGFGKRKRVYHYVICDLCGNKFRSKKLVIAHKHKKHDIPLEDNKEFKVYYCEAPNCGFKTLFEFMLKNHSEIHGEERPFMCEICSKTFKQKTGLGVHMQNVHGRTETTLTCHCGKILKSQRALKFHIRRVHDQEKNHPCEQCDYSAFDKPNLQQHMFAKHGVALPDHVVRYPCEHCPFVTRWRNQYMNHIRRHTGYHPFVCQVCKKGFVCASDLTGHMKWHKEKTHKCHYDNCKFSSISAGKLQQHIRKIHTHRDIKPYNCDICGYRTNVHGNLLAHTRKVHKIKVASKQHLVKQLDEDLREVERNEAKMTAISRETSAGNPSEVLPSTDHMYSQNRTGHLAMPEELHDNAREKQAVDSQETTLNLQQIVDQHIAQQGGLVIAESNYNDTERAVGEATGSYPQLAGEVAAVLESMATPAQQVLYYQQGMAGQDANIQQGQMQSYHGHQGEVYMDDGARSKTGIPQSMDFNLPEFAPPSYEAATAAAEPGNISHTDQCDDNMGVYQQQQQNSDYTHQQPQYGSAHAPLFLNGQPIYSSNGTSAYTSSSLQELSSGAREFQHQSLISLLPASITDQRRLPYEQMDHRNVAYDSLDNASLPNPERITYGQIDGENQRIPYDALNETQAPVSSNQCVSYCSSNENLSSIPHSQRIPYPSMNPENNGEEGPLPTLSVYNHTTSSISEGQYMALPGPEQILAPREVMSTAQDIGSMQNTSYNLPVEGLPVGMTQTQQPDEENMDDSDTLVMSETVQLPIRQMDQM